MNRSSFRFRPAGRSAATAAAAVAAVLILCLSAAGAAVRREGKTEPRTPPLPPVRIDGPELQVPPPIFAFSSPWPPLYDTVRLVFIGDVMQHGYQIRSAFIPGRSRNDPDAYDYSRTFKYAEPALRGADLAVANMEFPAGGPPYSGYPLFSAPDAVVRQARESGIGLCLLANNHILDRGRAGLEKTLNLYDSLGIPHTGVYRSPEEEARLNPLLLDLKGIRIAFINFTYDTNGNPVPPPYRVCGMDSLQVKETIRRARERGAHLIVALPHWGEEYRLHPSEQQRAWARMLLRNGVRIIVGTHPHVPQSAEIRCSSPGKPSAEASAENIVFYSLGNFISNQSRPDYTQLELMVEITAVRNNVTREITLPAPRWTWLWCFKKDEFEDDYTAVPAEEALAHPEKVRSADQYRRMADTYRDILRKNLITFTYDSPAGSGRTALQ